MKAFSMFAAVVLVATTTHAAEVSVEGTHICCGACVKGIEKALGGAKGVSDVKIDKEKKTISFKAEDRKGVRSGIVALARAGFAGQIKIDGKAIGRRKKKGKKAKARLVSNPTLRGPHNCCPGCAKAIATALKGVDGVKNVQCEKRIIKITGDDVNVGAAIAALRKAGFAARYGTRKKPKKKKSE
ncbi:MAG: hypothetical protein Tsb009_14670 [Planctomycetaceae bacterium]